MYIQKDNAQHKKVPAVYIVVYNGDFTNIDGMVVTTRKAEDS